jgi:hypothetical protein
MPSRPPGLFHVLAQACARKWRRKMLSPRPSRPRHRAPNSRRAAPPPRRGAAAASAPPRARCRLSCRSQCRLTVAEMLTATLRQPRERLSPCPAPSKPATSTHAHLPYDRSALQPPTSVAIKHSIAAPGPRRPPPNSISHNSQRTTRRCAPPSSWHPAPRAPASLCAACRGCV